jgi:hypothetical protein
MVAPRTVWPCHPPFWMFYSGNRPLHAATVRSANTTICTLANRLAGRVPTLKTGIPIRTETKKQNAVINGGRNKDEIYEIGEINPQYTISDSQRQSIAIKASIRRLVELRDAMVT